MPLPQLLALFRALRVRSLAVVPRAAPLLGVVTREALLAAMAAQEQREGSSDGDKRGYVF